LGGGGLEGRAHSIGLQTHIPNGRRGCFSAQLLKKGSGETRGGGRNATGEVRVPDGRQKCNGLKKKKPDCNLAGERPELKKTEGRMIDR